MQYANAIIAIKQTIMQSRYTAARMVNSEMLALYYRVGEYISQHSRNDIWGTGALDVISNATATRIAGTSRLFGYKFEKNANIL